MRRTAPQLHGRRLRCGGTPVTAIRRTTPAAPGLRRRSLGGTRDVHRVGSVVQPVIVRKVGDGYESSRGSGAGGRPSRPDSPSSPRSSGLPPTWKASNWRSSRTSCGSSSMRWTRPRPQVLLEDLGVTQEKLAARVGRADRRSPIRSGYWTSLPGPRVSRGRHVVEDMPAPCSASRAGEQIRLARRLWTRACRCVSGGRGRRRGETKKRKSPCISQSLRGDPGSDPGLLLRPAGRYPKVRDKGRGRYRGAIQRLGGACAVARSPALTQQPRLPRDRAFHPASDSEVLHCRLG